MKKQKLTKEQKNEIWNAKDIFERGKVEGMEEIWKALLDAYEGRSLSDNRKIFGYRTVGEILEALSPTQFMNKYHEHKEKEAHDIKIGDEVILITSFVSDDSVCGIVYNIIEAAECPKYYRMISSGSSISYTFSDNSIINGNVRKTGKYFDHIPFDYIA